MRTQVWSLALSFAFFAACTETGEEAAPFSGRAGQPAAGVGAVGGTGTAGGGPMGGSSGSGGGSAGLTGSGGSLGGGAGSSGTAGSATSGGSGGAGALSGGAGGAGGNGKGAAGAGDGGSSARAGTGGEGGAGEPELTSFRIAVIGSSTAAGEGASSSSLGWVSLLAASLEDSVVGDFTSLNLARGGYTSVELVPGSDADGSIDDAIDRDPNLIVLSLAGSNDLSAGTSTSTFMARLTSIRDAAVEAGVPIFFVSTAPKDLSTSERETLRDWAEEMGMRFSTCWVPGGSGQHSPCFIDLFETLANSSLGVANEYSAGDGIHLNDTGHAAIHEAALPVIRPYVCSMTACR